VSDHESGKNPKTSAKSELLRHAFGRYCALAVTERRAWLRGIEQCRAASYSLCTKKAFYRKYYLKQRENKLLGIDKSGIIQPPDVA
jgi:hypothetical protein